MLNNENKKKILIIKEAKAFNNVIKRYFQEKEYEVEISTNSSDVINKAIKIKPVMIIVDMDLPNSSGFIISEKIKKNNELKDIPVLVASQGKQVFIDKTINNIDILPINSFKSFRENKVELYN